MLKDARRNAATRFLLVAAVLFLTRVGVHAQSTDNFVFTTYGMEEGLSGGTVEAILQDSTGFLWVGTHGGVDRFDGLGFHSFRHRRGDPTSLVGDYVLALAQAERGKLWVGMEGEGLNLLDPLTGTATHVGLDSLGPWSTDAGFEVVDREGRTVRAIATVSNGSLVLLTDVGPAWFDPTTERYGSLSDWSRASATALCELPDDRVVVGFSDGSLGLLRSAQAGSDPTVEPADVDRPLRLPSRVDAIRCPVQGTTVLVGSGGGAVWEVDVDDADTSLLGHLPDAGGETRQIQDLLRMGDGTVWIATDAGVWRIPPGGEVAAPVAGGGEGRAIPHSDVRQLLVDARGVLWIGTWNGLASLHPLQATMRRVLIGPRGGVGLRGEGVIAIETDARGRVWLGTDGGGVQRLEGDWRSGDVRAVTPAAFGPWDDAVVFGLDADRRGGLWIAAWGRGVLHMRPDGTVDEIPVIGDSGEVVESDVYSVLSDERGEVWAGSYALGVLRFDSERGAFAPLLLGDERRRLGSDWVWPLAEDDQGVLWIGAYNAGLVSIGPDRTSVHLFREGPESLSNSRALCVFADSEGIVWVGTQGGGLNRFDPRTGGFRVYGVDDGLPHQTVEAVVEDQRGYLWVSTAEGLARLDRETGEFLTFTDVAGLAGDHFLANAAHLAPGGELFFGGPAGITVIDPADIQRREVPPEAALTSFRIQGREAPIARAMAEEGLDLEPDENFFAFEFAAMDFVDASQNRYRYQLEGLDPGWIDAGASTMANYTSVPPDRYVFRVAARNSEGIWNEDAMSISLRVQAPFHQTAWFRSVVLLAVLGLAWSLYSYRRRELEARERLRIQAREKLRSEIAGELHDDIGANLSTIVQKAWMVGSVSGLDERGRSHLQDMSRLASESVDSVRETVWVVNTKYDTVADLATKMRDTVDTMLGGQVQHSFKKDVEQPDLALSMETRRNVYLMFKESLHNILKHASATVVGIELEVTKEELHFQVSDDGVGFDPAKAGGGSGQDLLRHRAELCRGSVQVTSEPGNGTTVDVRASLS